MQRASTSRLKTAPGSCLVAMLAGLLVTLPAAAGGARGSVLAWGCQDYTGKDFGECTVPAAARSGVKAIAASGSSSLALTQDGRVLAWGCHTNPDSGQCDVPTAAKSGVTEIAAGPSQSLALTRGGRVL